MPRALTRIELRHRQPRVGPPFDIVDQPGLIRRGKLAQGVELGVGKTAQARGIRAAVEAGRVEQGGKRRGRRDLRVEFVDLGVGKKPARPLVRVDRGPAVIGCFLCVVWWCGCVCACVNQEARGRGDGRANNLLDVEKAAVKARRERGPPPNVGKRDATYLC